MTGRSIAVLGAGLAGLTAAYRLGAAGARVTVYEAASHVGGRARTDSIDGFRVDAGAQLVGSMYVRFRELARELGLTDALVPAPGRDALWRKGRVHEVVYGSVASMIASGGLPLTTKMRLGAFYVPFLSKHADALRTLRPESAAAAGLDDETIEAWGQREIDDAFVRSLVYPQLGAYYGSLPSETSAGFYHILARHGMDVTLEAVRGGIGTVAETLAERVRDAGGQIRLDASVARLSAGHDSVRVMTSADELAYDGAVSALPASVLRDVLDTAPPALTEWLSAVRYRPVLTVALLLDRPLDARFFGLSFPRGDTRFVAAICVEQNKPAELVPPGKGLLLIIPTPETSPALIGMESRDIVERVLPEVDQALPGVEGRIERARVYRYPTGTPVFFPGYLTHLGRFRATEPEGDMALTLAGDYLYGPSVEGAVESGNQAAARLADRLASVS